MLHSEEFRLTPGQIKYLGMWMNKVSRSFAIVVAAVEEPLKHYLSTAYLLCRVIDNIEDCTQPHDWKKDRFAEISSILNEPAIASGVLADWEKEQWPGLTTDEEQIMGMSNGSRLWEIYGLIPEAPRNIIRRWTQAMASGMSQLDDPKVPPQFIEIQDVQVLRGEQDYDGYCYYVAGTVGYMATELMVEHYGVPDSIAEKLIQNAESCGRGLQKTNIIKDFPKDLMRGVSYLSEERLREIDYSPLSLKGAPLPWKMKVLENVLDELDEATEYLVTLPRNAVGYRKASLLCLLPAYQTLLLAAEEKDKLFTPDHQVKISHETMAQCLFDTEQLATDNEGIRQYSHRARQTIEESFRLSGAAIDRKVTKINGKFTSGAVSEQHLE